jgi:hypothetical protein
MAQSPESLPAPEPPPVARLKLHLLFGDSATGALVALLLAAALAVGGLFELGVQAGSPMAGAVAAVGGMFAGVGVLFILLQRA